MFNGILGHLSSIYLSKESDLTKGASINHVTRYGGSGGGRRSVTLCDKGREIS